MNDTQLEDEYKQFTQYFQVFLFQLNNTELLVTKSINHLT